MKNLFISHSSNDDTFVRNLRLALADQGQDAWIDSRELSGGDHLWPAIQSAIENAAAFAIVVSPDSLQSRAVGKELRHALEVQKRRGKDDFPVVPLSLNATRLGVLEEFFDYEPIYIPVSDTAGGVEAAVHAILVAIGKRLPADVASVAQPKPDPVEELVLELSDLKFVEQNNTRRASARARLVYEPATPGQPHVHSAQSWRFIAPIGPIEGDELRWYLEKYAIWPSPYFQDRAREIEKNLITWGQLLYEKAMPAIHRENVMKAWEKTQHHTGRRFAVQVDVASEVDAPEEDVKAAQEVATLLLGLPWELLHDGQSYLFQGGKPMRVRRRLPAVKSLDVPVVDTPIRILLVTARPEDESCSYIDHRASALPLVEAMESLPGLVKIHVLSPPTVPALRQELDRAAAEKKPYHVIHFDGHGIYDRNLGLGGLCFELPKDVGKLELRRHITVFTNELGPLLKEYRVPLVFLEACQTAQAEKASESVASELLKVGVASVVAMSYAVLVETSRRFVEAFYDSLAAGKRVGDAMLEGQRQLKDDSFRGSVFGAGELRLEDWFVPVLYQEKDDPQLFKTAPAKQTQEDFKVALAVRLGELPPAPETGFVGRSRDLLALQRLLRHKRYAVVTGQGGEGKTVLAAEFARWMVRSQQIRRAAFVSVEGIEENIVQSVVDKLGQQLVNPKFATGVDFKGDLAAAIQEVERALREQPTLLVLDNMESILLPPFLEKDMPETLSREAREELEAVLRLCERVLGVGETRLVFTSRETLPAPFDEKEHHRELAQLSREDAVKLVERVLNVSGNAETSSDAAQEEIEELVDAVHSHARTLALLAPSLRSSGVEATRKSLVKLMEEMEKKFPGSREKSVFASVELSLQRLSPENRERVRVLGVFHGGADLDMLRKMMNWKDDEVASLAMELVETRLATPNLHNHLTFNPALCPYLRGQMSTPEYVMLTMRWEAQMLFYVGFLSREQFRDSQLATTLTLLELGNLFVLLDLVQQAGDAAETIDLSVALFGLLEPLGKPRLLERVGRVRDAAAAELDKTWSHARFEAERSHVEQHLAEGRLRQALDETQQILQNVRAAGETAYKGVKYDIAGAVLLMGRVLKTAGASEQALPLLQEAQQRFEALATETDSKSAAGMAAKCLGEQGACFLYLGRLDEAANAYSEDMRQHEELGAERDVAVAGSQLGSVRLAQRRFKEALKAYDKARQKFILLKEPSSVGKVSGMIGIVFREIGEYDRADEAQREALKIFVSIGDKIGEAITLGELGNLYHLGFGRFEESAAFYRKAADKFFEVGDFSKESVARNNLAGTLRELNRLDEARQEIRRTIEISSRVGHVAKPWLGWANLADIERDSGHLAAAKEADQKAVACYLAYRRDGGENHFMPGRISLAVTRGLLAGDRAGASSWLEKLVADPAIEEALPFVRALQAIVGGSRDRTLAEAPELDYMMAAEILFLLDTLEKSG